MSLPSRPTPHEQHEVFMQLLARHEPAIRAYLRALLPRANDVDDLMPDIALVAWRKFSDLEELDAFPRWVCVIARYEVLRFRRDKARDRLILDEAVVAKLADEGATESGLRERQMAALERCIERLPVPRRDLLLSCYRSDLFIKDIAQRTGHTVDGLYQLLRRIRLDLQRCIETTLDKEAQP